MFPPKRGRDGDYIKKTPSTPCTVISLKFANRFLKGLFSFPPNRFQSCAGQDSAHMHTHARTHPHKHIYTHKYTHANTHTVLGGGPWAGTGLRIQASLLGSQSHSRARLCARSPACCVCVSVLKQDFTKQPHPVCERCRHAQSSSYLKR